MEEELASAKVLFLVFFCMCTHMHSTLSVPVKLCPLHSHYNGIQGQEQYIIWFAEL